MLRRVALALVLLTVSGLAAIFAAGHFGVRLPWEVTTAPSSSHKDTAATGEASPKAAEQAAGSAEKAIEDTTAALTVPNAAEPAPGSVAIDIARISPDGSSVFAGRAEPDTYVTVLEDGKPTGTVKADANGEWSLATEHKFASTDPKLSYQVSKTPPPAPEPPKIAKAELAKPSAASVAGDVMRKFENLVEEAREEAKKETEKATAENAPTPKPELKLEPQASGSDTVTAETGIGTGSASTSSSAGSTAAAGSNTNATATASASSNAKPDATASERTATAAVHTDVIPVPIMFVYNEATLTTDGRRAADLLLEYLTLKHLNSVELSGHADERGSDDYNFDLSRERLEAVSQILRDGGYTGELKLTPKGKSEPYTGVDRTAYSGEALFQLDRRVELRVTR